MFSKNIKKLFRSAVKAANAVADFAQAAKEVYQEAVVICRLASDLWRSFKA